MWVHTPKSIFIHGIDYLRSGAPRTICASNIEEPLQAYFRCPAHTVSNCNDWTFSAIYFHCLHYCHHTKVHLVWLYNLAVAMRYCSVIGCTSELRKRKNLYSFPHVVADWTFQRHREHLPCLWTFEWRRTIRWPAGGSPVPGTCHPCQLIYTNKTDQTSTGLRAKWIKVVYNRTDSWWFHRYFKTIRGEL